MILDQFRLTDARFSKIAPLLPTDTRGKARVDDRPQRVPAAGRERRRDAEPPAQGQPKMEERIADTVSYSL
jgi:hypothetical protein